MQDMMKQEIENIVKMGWYIDTSLLMDFIDRNIRKGFSDSEPYDGKTIKNVTCGAGVHKFVPAIADGMRFTFELTTNIDYLRNIHFTHKTSFYYSELTKEEVLRSLRKSHAKSDQEEIISWWKALCFLMKDYKKVKSENLLGQELPELALAFPISKNVQDYIHLILAKQNKLAFITSDKLNGQIDAIRENYYSQIYYWPEIKKDIPILPELET